MTGLPVKFLRTVAGFPSTGGGYYLTRAEIEPPELLLKQLWPWIEYWEERFLRHAEGKRWAKGGLDADDMAGQAFLRLLKHLRMVLLQDIAVLQPCELLSHPFEYLLTNYIYLQLSLDCRSLLMSLFLALSGTLLPPPFVLTLRRTQKLQVCFYSGLSLS